jgi:hypothetical protein
MKTAPYGQGLTRVFDWRDTPQPSAGNVGSLLLSTESAQYAG